MQRVRMTELMRGMASNVPFGDGVAYPRGYNAARAGRVFRDAGLRRRGVRVSAESDSHDIEGRGHGGAGPADAEVGGRVTLEYQSARSVVRPASGEVASAVVGVTIFGAAGLLIGLMAIGAVLDGEASFLGICVPVMIGFGWGVWVNARVIVRKRG